MRKINIMNKKVLWISVGSAVILGISGFFFWKHLKKKKKNKLLLEESQEIVEEEQEQQEETKEMEQRLKGKRVLVTQAEEYMGPDTITLFSEHGAEIIADTRVLTEVGATEDLIAEAGHVDVLIAILAANAGKPTPATDNNDQHWETMFNVMVHPLHRL